MSGTGTDITSETGITVDTRPTVNVAADRYSLPSTYQYPERQVVPSTSVLIGQEAGLEQDFFKPTIGPTPVGQDKFLLYTGPRLVNERGVITNRGAYDPDEAYGVLASLSKAERLTLQSELYSRGLYGGSRPSASGFDSQDIGAMQQYLLLANRFGVTADSLRSPALTYLRSEYPVVEKSGGARARVSSKEDISEVLRGESLRLLGRAMTPAEVRQAVSYVQQTQAQRQMAGQDVPALSTLGEMAVGEGRETEMQVQGAARAAAVLERLLGR